MKNRRDEKRERLSKSAASGAVALIFLIIGFQLAVFVLKVVQRPVAPAAAASVKSVSGTPPVASTPQAPAQATPAHSQEQLPRVSSNVSRPVAGSSSVSRPRRKVESFRFDPNTVSMEDLVRLGLSEKQAESIENYRSKGGKFRAREDFAKMYVVSDTLYERLKEFIDIPKLELNSADTTTLTTLRGIGPYYARRIIEHRDSLGGYFTPEQLLEIRGIDSARFCGFASGITADTLLIKKINLSAASEADLAAHPYIGRISARGIARYARLCSEKPEIGHISLQKLMKEDIISLETAEKLRPYIVDNLQ